MDPSDTIRDVKNKIESKGEVVPLHHQRLVFGEKQLEDKRTLLDYGIQSKDTLCYTYFRGVMQSNETIQANRKPHILILISALTSLITERSSQIENLTQLRGKVEESEESINEEKKETAQKSGAAWLASAVSTASVLATGGGLLPVVALIGSVGYSVKKGVDAGGTAISRNSIALDHLLDVELIVNQTKGSEVYCEDLYHAIDERSDTETAAQNFVRTEITMTHQEMQKRLSKQKSEDVYKGAAVVAGFAGLACAAPPLLVLPVYLTGLLSGDYLSCKWQKNDVLQFIEKLILELNANMHLLENEKRTFEANVHGSSISTPPSSMFKSRKSLDK